MMFRLLFIIVLFRSGGASDDSDDLIERPCPNNSLSCIRKYFVSHSCCKLPKRAMPDIIIRPDILVVGYGTANVTGKYDSFAYSGIKGDILDFYVNPSTDNVVLVVKLPKLTLTTNKTALFFHRLGFEPVSVADRTTVHFTDTILTATIPNVDNMQMKDAFITTYTYNGYPEFTMGDNFYNNNVTKPYLQKFLSNIPDAVQHIIQRVTPFALHMYVKFNICDFRLPLKVYLQ